MAHNNGKKIQSINLTFASQNGRRVKAPLEIWIAALISSLSNESRQNVLNMVDRMMVQRAVQMPTRILTDLSMPPT